ncbi:SixA phosphatase family protein [Mangrovitalea sediminis]|uniref:SixA phosphatase family protein n=1 Tax=Mangrovitalea sediminis TaxID=1982043 RepID=UPI000BE5571C|nr:histidine phosphatase family protein [Mangrovitalea sediminis]
MKTLTLLRHAKSSWKDTSLKDFDRPLNKRGKKQSAAMGDLLASLHWSPDILVASPAVRTYNTARCVGAHLSLKTSALTTDKTLYNADWSQLFECICRTPDHIDHLMICAHNPGLTDVINRLSDSHITNLPTCGLAAIRFSVKSWSGLDQVQGTLSLLLTPKGLNFR